MDDSLLITARAVAGREISTNRRNPIRVDIKNGKAQMFCEGRTFVFEAYDLQGLNKQGYSISRKAFPRVEKSFSNFVDSIQMPNREISTRPRIPARWEIKRGATPHRDD